MDVVAYLPFVLLGYLHGVRLLNRCDVLVKPWSLVQFQLSGLQYDIWFASPR